MYRTVFVVEHKLLTHKDLHLPSPLFAPNFFLFYCVLVLQKESSDDFWTDFLEKSSIRKIITLLV